MSWRRLLGALILFCGSVALGSFSSEMDQASFWFILVKAAPYACMFTPSPSNRFLSRRHKRRCRLRGSKEGWFHAKWKIAKGWLSNRVVQIIYGLIYLYFSIWMIALHVPRATHTRNLKSCLITFHSLTAADSVTLVVSIAVSSMLPDTSSSKVKIKANHYRGSSKRQIKGILATDDAVHRRVRKDSANLKILPDRRPQPANEVSFELEAVVVEA